MTPVVIDDDDDDDHHHHHHLGLEQEESCIAVRW
jgi:hypothetical protein